MIGRYVWDDRGLPVFVYTGEYPAKARDKNGEDACLPEDPCFLLGNSRITAFAHVSGGLELITGERGWARLNHAGGNGFHNRAKILVCGEEHILRGDMDRRFGVGIASYRDVLPIGVDVQRVITVNASAQPRLAVRVTVSNGSEQPVDAVFDEEMLANYVMLSAQEDLLGSDPPIVYERTCGCTGEQVWVQFAFRPRKLMIKADTPQHRHPYDCFPPRLYLQAVSGIHPVIREDGKYLCCTSRFRLEPGELRVMEYVIGLSFDSEPESAEVIRWEDRLAGLLQEQDEVLCWEMIWNAYTLLGMATFHRYFGETMVPQGSVYAYRLGQNASGRDHLQHTLPLCRLDANLAKSCLRYMMKRMCPDGRIIRQDVGFGYEDQDVYFESDPQLYLMLAVGEYLAVTKDYAFLDETVELYPAEERQRATVLETLVRGFIWLRDVVRCGRHGLVMMRNSDWSDSFFHPYSPNLYSQVAESHLNTAMALVVLPKLAEQLSLYRGNHENLACQLSAELRQWRDGLNHAFMKDMEGRIFAPRCYIGFDDDPALRFGEDRLCLEAQSWVLMMEDFPIARKHQLWAAVRSRVLDMEPLGARMRERPLWSEEGRGEDGGMWYAHQGPLVLGAAAVCREDALQLLRKLTFRNYSQRYPDYWIGHWTAPDSFESTLSPREGLYHFWCSNPFQPYCAHIHAWMLFCYQLLFSE